jgi:hypothetical protein
MDAARHPNDAAEVRRRLATDVLAMSPRELRELRLLLDRALARLPEGTSAQPRRTSPAA